jgi:hypothetical protein
MPRRVRTYREITELLVEAHDQIAGPPAHDAIDRRDRPFLHETNKKRLVLLGEFAGRAPGDDLLTRPSGPSR